MNRAKSVVLVKGWFRNKRNRKKTNLELSNLEGVVNRSIHEEQSIFSPRSGLFIKIKDDDGYYWIRGEHRIDVGESVKLHLDSRDPARILAYEVFSENGNSKVKFRYCDGSCDFVDY